MMITKADINKPVKITWLDSISDTGWQDTRRLDKKDIRHALRQETVGYIVLVGGSGAIKGIITQF